jgi:hypothetical protein
MSVASVGSEQHVRGFIAKGALQLVDHQAIAIDAETVLGDGGACHVAAHALELAPPALLAS